jgi:type II secretion system protein N
LNGALDLRATGLALEDGKIRGITVPPLHFPNVHVAATVDAGRLQIRELVGDGQEIAIRGSGHALLREPAASSLLNLELVLTPTAAAADNLRLALNLLPGKTVDGGGREVRVSGTLSQLRVR